MWAALLDRHPGVDADRLRADLAAPLDSDPQDVDARRAALLAGHGWTPGGDVSG